MSHPVISYSKGGSFTMMKTSAAHPKLRTKQPVLLAKSDKDGSVPQKTGAFNSATINCRQHLIFPPLNTLDRKPVQLARCYSNDLRDRRKLSVEAQVRFLPQSRLISEGLTEMTLFWLGFVSAFGVSSLIALLCLTIIKSST